MRALRRLSAFTLGCLLELSLLGAAALLAWWLGRPLWTQFTGSFGDAWLGVLATAPALGGFCLLQWLPWRPLARIREWLEAVLPRWFGGCSWWQLALISAIAGVSEEALFRGLLQGWLSDCLGATAGLALASVVFGLGHAVTPAYAVIATLIGAYLGGLWLATGNLVAPALTHGLYDFVALLWLLRASASRKAPALN